MYQKSTGISGAGGHAHMLYTKIQNGTVRDIHAITEDEKQAFLNRSTHKCKWQKGRVSIAGCKKNIERAKKIKASKNILYDNDIFLKCLSCKYSKKINVDKKKIVQKKKPCKTFLEFGELCYTSEKGGWCLENMDTHGHYARGHFNNKMFCCRECAARYNHLKNKGNFAVDGVMYRWAERKIEVVA